MNHFIHMDSCYLKDEIDKGMGTGMKFDNTFFNEDGSTNVNKLVAYDIKQVDYTPTSTIITLEYNPWRNKKGGEIKISKGTHAERSQIKDVKIKRPATIIFWKDGSKTVSVQRAGDIAWDSEKGFTFAYLKHGEFEYKQFCWDLKHFCKQEA